MLLAGWVSTFETLSAAYPDNRVETALEAPQSPLENSPRGLRYRTVIPSRVGCQIPFPSLSR